MGRIVILDPTAPPMDDATWDAPRVGRPLRGLTVGLRLDESWRCYYTVLDAWESLLREAGAEVERFVVHARVATAGAQMRDDLDEWRRLVDCAVVGLGN
jgi:hypothetical protein